jgi:methionyl-tRNA formyltransferase
VKVVFFGTPQVAVPFLEALVEGGHRIVSVVCQPDKPSGRKMQLASPPVKIYAASQNIPVLQPVKLDECSAEIIASLKADIGVVVAYGKLIPRSVFSAPTYGCFNIHFSLLPRYRGAAPFQWTLINGERETGVSIFWLEETLDSGPVLSQTNAAIMPEEDAPSLLNRLTELGVHDMLNTLEQIQAGNCTGKKQEGTPTFAPQLKKEDGRIAWSKPALTIFNLMRGTKPWPGIHTTFKGETLKILSATVNNSSGRPGEIIELVKDKGIVVACGESSLLVTEVHPANKKAMSAWSYAQGLHLHTGDKLI